MSLPLVCSPVKLSLFPGLPGREDGPAGAVGFVSDHPSDGAGQVCVMDTEADGTGSGVGHQASRAAEPGSLPLPAPWRASPRLPEALSIGATFRAVTARRACSRSCAVTHPPDASGRVTRRGPLCWGTSKLRSARSPSESYHDPGPHGWDPSTRSTALSTSARHPVHPHVHCQPSSVHRIVTRQSWTGQRANRSMGVSCQVTPPPVVAAPIPPSSSSRPTASTAGRGRDGFGRSRHTAQPPCRDGHATGVSRASPPRCSSYGCVRSCEADPEPRRFLL